VPTTRQVAGLFATRVALDAGPSAHSPPRVTDDHGRRQVIPGDSNIHDTVGKVFDFGSSNEITQQELIELHVEEPGRFYVVRPIRFTTTIYTVLLSYMVSPHPLKAHAAYR